MRITNKMMINNSKYWLSKQAEKLADAEIVSASGKQINKPSDDPAAAAQILEYRSEIAKYDQYQTNIDTASTYIEAGETVLDSADSYLDQALEIASDLASGSSDYTGTYLESLQGIYDSIIGLGNTMLSSSYMYGGTDTDSMPFSNEITLSSAGADTDIGVYLASAASITITISDSSGNVVRTLTSSGVAESNTITWDGQNNSGTDVAAGDYTFTISATDSSGNTVSSLSYQGDSGSKSFYISDGNTIEINCDGGEIFSKALLAISDLISGIKGYNEGTVDDATLTACATAVTESLNDASADITNERVALANIYSQLDVSTDRVDKLSELLQEKLSAVETGDTTEAAVELSAQETAYELTTEATAKILNLPKLSDYI